MKTCLRCGKPLTAEQRHNIYCSHECSIKYQQEKKINAWLNGDSNGTIANGVLSETIRQYLITKANHSCELCGWNQINPITNTVPLEIHHKDGNYLNNNIENLQVLCPNCHSLTPNYRNLNRTFSSTRERGTARKKFCVDCGKPISDDAIRCQDCFGKHQTELLHARIPSKDELKQLIRTKSFVQIGKDNGVSDNAIRKWCIGYGLPSKKKDIKKYSDEEWAAL